MNEKGQTVSVGSVATGSDAVGISLRTAELIRRVWLPKNPNKMRDVDPEVVQAARDFIAAYDAAKARRQNVPDEPRAE